MPSNPKSAPGDVFESSADNDLSKSALLALRLSALPEVQKAKQVVRDFFFLPHALSGSPDVTSTLDATIEETAFAAMLAVAGSDPMNPQLAMYEAPPYRLSGQAIPGSRYGFDNGDRVFRHFFVNPAFRYEIRGRRPQGAASANMVLESCEDKPPGWGYPLTFLRLKDMTIDADGRFVIVADSAPPAGRSNHLWLPPGAAHVLIRDSYLDWSSELPTALSVHRVSGPPSAPALPFEVMARLAGPKVIEHAMNCFRWYDWGVAPVLMNAIPPPFIRPSPPGEAPWGMTGTGKYRIADDEALVFTVDPVTARYVGATVATAWMVGRDYISRTGCLNNFQAAANPDGSITFVIALHDPGVQNWLDTDGIHEGILLLRWELLQTTPDPKTAVRDVKVVQLKELTRALPFATPVFTPEDRRRQLAARHAAIMRRLGTVLPPR